MRLIRIGNTILNFDLMRQVEFEESSQEANIIWHGGDLTPITGQPASDLFDFLLERAITHIPVPRFQDQGRDDDQSDRLGQR